MRKYLLFALAACTAISPLAAQKAEKSAEESAPAAAQMPPPEVSFVVAEPADVPKSFQHLGIVEPSRVAEVRARVRGFLSERLFEEGQYVGEGQVLYRIEPQPFEADVAVAEARVAEAEARLRLAERQRERVESLLASGASTQGDVDKAHAEYETALASLNLTKADLEKTRIQLSYTEIKAPMSGIIGTTAKDVGALVDDGSNSLLARISRVSPIYVSFGISEREYLSKKAALLSNQIYLTNGGREFSIMLQDGTIYDETGTLNFEDTGFMGGTGSLQMRVEFPNAEQVLKPGQFVRVIEKGWTARDVLAVPKRSVNQSPAGSFVFVIDDQNVLQYRPVTVGQWMGTQWQITSGIEPGERVMVDGLMKARPGSPVQPVPHVVEEAAAPNTGEGERQVAGSAGKGGSAE